MWRENLRFNRMNGGLSLLVGRKRQNTKGGSGTLVDLLWAILPCRGVRGRTSAGVEMTDGVGEMILAIMFLHCFEETVKRNLKKTNLTSKNFRQQS